MKKQTRFFKVFVKLSSILIVLLISDIAQALSNEKSNIATNGISEQQKTAGKRLKRSSTTGSIQVIISPDEAVLAGAKWSIDSGASWNSTDENISSNTGTQTITFSSLNGYTTPDDTVITVVEDETQILTVTYTDEDSYPNAYKGYTLYMPKGNTEAYLMDNYGNTVHSWDTGYAPSNSCYLPGTGNFLQTADMGDSIFDAAGTGGRVMEVAANGSTNWTFDYYSDEYILHHDIEYMSNGNVLMIAFELISYDDALAAGRKPRYLDDDGLYSDMILEVNPSTGEIIWQWRVWDHLIQEQNANKPNYGTAADHPEKIDLNYTTQYPDYNHFNSVDYNEELDQILISCRNYDEIWIIDHSTTTEEAASDSGGTYGKGGDLLYRWGNPEAYGAGDSDDQKLFGQHDANWIDSDYPGEGNILIFNNGNGRPTTGDNYSSIEEITPPVDDDGNYSLTTGAAYEPSETTWTYEIDSDYYSSAISGTQRLPNGNTLICSGGNGYFLEVDASKNVVWTYGLDDSKVFKIRRYGVDYEGLAEILDTGELTVTISTTDGINAGAQWNINDGEWHDSGETVNVVIGTHVIGFSTVDGYDSPDSQTITIGSDEIETITAEYVVQSTSETGALCVTIEPSDAQWTIDNGTSWYDSETTLSDLDTGDYTVSFSDITDYITPDDQTVSVLDGETTSISVIYESEETGSASLTVSIKPDSVVSSGAMWSIDDGDEWISSDDTISDLDAGDYTIKFKRVSGWRKPKSQTVSIEEGEDSSTTGTYRVSQGTATLIVDIKPSQVKAMGAQWKLDDGDWQSTTSSMVESADYLLSFSQIPGWRTPDSIEIGLDENATELIIGQYYLYGDADSNEIVDLADMIKIQQVLTGVPHDLPDKLDVLDLSLDGALGISDVIKVFQNISDSGN
jgi:hypothetical protein